MRFQGKVALITAAGSGMGRAGATRMAREGGKVVVVDVSEEAANSVVAEIEAAGGQALALCGDLRDEGFSEDIVARACAHFGGLDLLWNHIGHPGPSTFEDLDMSAYELALDLNYRTVLVTTKRAVGELRKRGGGSILFTSSTAGLHGAPVSPVYTSLKFAVQGLARSLARRYAKEHIRVNAVCPGMIDTPMLRVFASRPDTPNHDPSKLEEAVISKVSGVPMGRPGKPEEVASAALYLLSDEASYITGVTLPVDGGSVA